MLCCLFLLLCTAYVGYAGEVFSKPLPPRYVNSQFTDLSLSKSSARDTRSALSLHYDYAVSRKDAPFSRNKRQTNDVIEREAGKSNGKMAQERAVQQKAVQTKRRARESQKKRTLTRRSSSNEVARRARLAKYRQRLLRRKAQLEAQRRQQIKLARARLRNRRRKIGVVQNLQRKRARLGARLGDKQEKRIFKNNFKLNGPAWKSRPRARKRMPRPTSRPYKAKPTVRPKRRDPSVNSMLMALKQKKQNNRRKEVAKLDKMLSDTRNKKVIKNTMKMNQLKVASKKSKANRKFKKVPLTPTTKQKKPTPPSPFGVQRPSKGRKKGRKNKLNFGNLFKRKGKRPQTRPFALPQTRPQTRPHPIPQTRPQTRPHPIPQTRPFAIPQTRPQTRPHTRPRPTSKAAQNDSSVNIIIPLLWSFLFYAKTFMY